MKKRIIILIAFLCISIFLPIGEVYTVYAGNELETDGVKGLKGLFISIKNQYFMSHSDPLDADTFVSYANFLCSNDATIIWDDYFDNDGIVGNTFSKDRMLADGNYFLFQSETDDIDKKNTLILISMNEFRVEEITDKLEAFDILDQMDKIKNDGTLQDSFRQSMSKDEFLSNSKINIILKSDQFQIIGGELKKEGDAVYAETELDSQRVKGLIGVVSSIKDQYLLSHPNPLEDADELITYANYLSKNVAILIWDDVFDSDNIVGNTFSNKRYYADGKYILFQAENDVVCQDDTLILIDVIGLSVKKITDRSDIFNILTQIDKGEKFNIVQDTFNQTVSESKFIQNIRIKIKLQTDRFQITGGSDPNGEKVIVKKVILDVKSISLKQGEEYQLTAIVMPYDASVQKVKWSSGNSSIASVDNKGVITAKKVGTVNIQVTTVDGNKTFKCKVSVKKNPNYYSVGQTATLNCAGKYEGITWTSSNTDVVRIIDTYDQTCTIKCLKEGTATVIAYVDSYEYYYDPIYELIDRELVREDYVHYEIIVKKKD